MKKIVLLISTFCIFHILSCIGPNAQNIELEKGIIKILNEQPGTYAIAYKDLEDSSKFFYYKAHELFHAASTMKTPVLFELFKQEKDGVLNRHDSVVINNEFVSIVDSSIFSMDLTQDSDEVLYERIGKNATLNELAYEMIIRSSNLATNVLIDILNANNVTKSMREIGAENILVLRGVEDLKAYEKGLSNRTTAYDLMLLFEKMARSELVDSASSQAMIDILLDQKFNDLIPGPLPNDVKVAHKTGSITKVLHDSGIVFLPDGQTYILVILSKEWENKNDAKQIINNISKLVYDQMYINPK